MPKYIAKKDIWLSHECRMAKAGDQFDTEFPKATVDGKQVDMELGENIELVQAPAKSGKKTEADLV